MRSVLRFPLSGSAWTILPASLLLIVSCKSRPDYIGELKNTSQVVAIETNPYELTVPAGTSDYLHATAIYDDGTSLDVTALAMWYSTDEEIAVADSNGMVTGISEGLVKVVPSYGGLFGFPAEVEVTGTTAFNFRPEEVDAGSLARIQFVLSELTIPEGMNPEIKIEGVEGFGEGNDHFTYFDVTGDDTFFGTFLIPPFEQMKYLDVVVEIGDESLRRNDSLIVNHLDDPEEMTIPYEGNGSMSPFHTDLFIFSALSPWTAFRFSSGDGDPDALVPYLSLWLFDAEGNLLVREDSWDSALYAGSGVLDLDFAVNEEEAGGDFYLLLAPSENAGISDITGTYTLGAQEAVAPGTPFRAAGEFPLEIPMDGSPLNSIITISDGDIIQDFNLYLKVLHPSPSDLVIDLIPPSGCSSLINIKNRSEGGLIAIYGLFRGVDDASESLDNLTGCSSGGDWTLSLKDEVPADSGTLEDWVILIN